MKIMGLIVFIILIIVVLVRVLFPWTPPSLSPSTNWSEFSGKIAEQCSLMEGRAQTLEKDHQDKNLSPGLASNDYSKAKHDYQSTKAGLDGWIGRVKIAIRTREPIGNTQPFLEDWVNRSQAFVALADGFDRKAQGLPPRLAIEGPHVSISLIPSLLEAATKIWVEFEKLDDERKDKMIRDLEGLKCKPWP